MRRKTKGRRHIPLEKRERIKAKLALDSPMRKIAREEGVGATSVKRIRSEIDDLGAYRRERKREFIGLAWETIKEATAQVRAKLPEASAAQAATVAGIYYDKQALAAGEVVRADPPPTINVLIGRIQQLIAPASAAGADQGVESVDQRGAGEAVEGGEYGRQQGS